MFASSPCSPRPHHHQQKINKRNNNRPLLTAVFTPVWTPDKRSVAPPHAHVVAVAGASVSGIAARAHAHDEARLVAAKHRQLWQHRETTALPPIATKSSCFCCVSLTHTLSLTFFLFLHTQTQELLLTLRRGRCLPPLFPNPPSLPPSLPPSALLLAAAWLALGCCFDGCLGDGLLSAARDVCWARRLQAMC